MTGQHPGSVERPLGLGSTRHPGALAPSLVSWHADAAAALTPQAPGGGAGEQRGFGMLICGI
jgi:hypothetical protein